MLTQQTQSGYSAIAVEKEAARIGVLKIKRRTTAISAVFLRPLHGFLWAAVQGIFDAPVNRLIRYANLYGSLTLW